MLKWKNLSVDKYFLETQNPYSKRRTLKTKNIAWLGGAVVFAFILGIIIWGGEAEKKGNVGAVPDYSNSNSSITAANMSAALSPSNSPNPSGGFSGSIGGGIGYGNAGGGVGRNRTANQVIRRGANGNDPGAQLPMGTTVPAKLINAIISTDSSTPVIAEVIDDIQTHGSTSIPAKTRVIGNAMYDDTAQRIQIRFHTFVYPDGDQHSLQGVGMMADGSAGLAGDYHSGTAKRQLGRFFGNFVGGFAQGMKERSAQGLSGISYEPGSVKNGLLNGVALSAEDQSKAISEDLSSTKASMSLAPGQVFIIFLEREYLP